MTRNCWFSGPSLIWWRYIRLRRQRSPDLGEDSAMKQVPKENTDEDLIQQYLNNGGTVSKGKTKPMPYDMGISKNTWGNKLTKEEKIAKNVK